MNNEHRNVPELRATGWPECRSAMRSGPPIASLGTTPVSVGLGGLVEREVASYRRRAASDADEVRDAVDEARVVADELAALIARLDEKHRAAA